MAPSGRLDLGQTTMERCPARDKSPSQPPNQSVSPPASRNAVPPLNVITASSNPCLGECFDQQICNDLNSPASSCFQGNDYYFRRMKQEDLPALATFMKGEGWNIDFDNMAVVFGLQPQAFYLAETAEGHIVGYCSGVCLDDSVAMLSYLIVSSQHRLRGLGTHLMSLSKRALGDRTVVFYSLENTIAFHRRQNFETCRFQTLVRDFSFDFRDFAYVPNNKDISVIRVQDADFEKLTQYDTSVNGKERADYLAKWVLKHENVAFAAIDAASGDVIGYISLSCADGRWDVIPLYADSDDIALRLLKQASHEIAVPVRVFVRIPADSSDVIGLFNTFRDILHHRVLYLMSDRPLSDITSHKVYSLSSVTYAIK